MSGWFSVPDWENTPGGGKSPATPVAPSGLKSNKKKNQKPNKIAAPNPQHKSKPQPVVPAQSSTGQFVRPPKPSGPTTDKPKTATKRKPENSANVAKSKASPAKKPKLEAAPKSQDAKVKPAKTVKKDAKVQKNSSSTPNGKAKSLNEPSNAKKGGKNIAKLTKETNGVPKKKPTDKQNGAGKATDPNPFESSNIKPLKSPKKKPTKPAKKLQLAAEDSDTELAAEVNLFRKKLLKGFTGAREVGPPNPNAKFSDDDDDLGLSDSDEEDSGPRQKKSKKAAEAKKVAAENAAKSALNAKQLGKAKKAEPVEEDGETAPELVAIAGTGAATAASANSSFRDKLIGNLKGSRFRFLNEQLYSSDGKAAVKLFKEDRAAFTAYHEGYRQQVQQWPLNPLDRIIKAIKKLPKTQVVADFGCGEGRLAKAVPNKTYSLDLVAQRHEIIACDMAKTPLETASIDVAVYCLSLMGTNLRDFILEANRVLKQGGQLKIAEVESRFEDVRQFVDNIKSCGFQHINTDTSSKFFVFLNFKKVHTVDKNNRQVPAFSLKPCLYKKR